MITERRLNLSLKAVLSHPQTLSANWENANLRLWNIAILEEKRKEKKTARLLRRVWPECPSQTIGRLSKQGGNLKKNSVKKKKTKTKKKKKKKKKKK